MLAARIVNLHCDVRKELYSELMRKIITGSAA
jgi:hypothetical protein